jgi:NAD(P)H-dependent FMN reductase
VAVICGSLRKLSTNAGLIKAIYEAKDQRFFFRWIKIVNFPVFNEDIEAVGIPADVQAAR